MHTSDLVTRIRDAAAATRDVEQALTRERDNRNELITHAVDAAGMTTAEVAGYAGVSQPQVCRILAKVCARYNDANDA